MGRKKMETRYRRFPAVLDWGGIKSAIGELRGIGYPPQPVLNKRAIHDGPDSIFDRASQKTPIDEAWFIKTIKDKIASHPVNSMEYPFFGERVFDEPLVGFIRGDDPIFDEYKKIIGPHHCCGSGCDPYVQQEKVSKCRLGISLVSSSYGLCCRAWNIRYA